MAGESDQKDEAAKSVLKRRLYFLHHFPNITGDYHCQGFGSASWRLCQDPAFEGELLEFHMQSEFPQTLFESTDRSGQTWAQTGLQNPPATPPQRCRIMRHHCHKSISELVGVPGHVRHGRLTGVGVVYKNEPAEERRARQVGRCSREIFAVLSELIR